MLTQSTQLAGEGRGRSVSAGSGGASIPSSEGNAVFRARPNCWRTHESGRGHAEDLDLDAGPPSASAKVWSSSDERAIREASTDYKLHALPGGPQNCVVMTHSRDQTGN
ncbi:hypothetical protein JCM18899A_42710 [Nocardioides sp. AN3]